MDHRGPSCPALRSSSRRPARHAAPSSGRAASAARRVVGSPRRDDGPEARAVTEHPQVGQLVDHDRLERLGRGEDQPPREGQAALARGAPPARPLVADRDRGGLTPSAAAWRAISRVDGGARSRLEPGLEDARRRASVAPARCGRRARPRRARRRGSTDDRRVPGRAGIEPQPMQLAAVAEQGAVAAGRPGRRARPGPRPGGRGGGAATPRARPGSHDAALRVAPSRGRPARGSVTTTPRSGWMTTRRPRARGERRSV